MVAMSLWATDLRQITGAIGSQVRMEIYARAGEKMATYYYAQKIAKDASGDIDLTDLDYTGSDSARRTAASHNVKVLGETKRYPRVTGHSDVSFLTNGKSLVSCALTFLKGTKKSELYASIRTADEWQTFEFVGTVDQAMYNRPIPGTLVLVAGRWAHLIDL